MGPELALALTAGGTVASMAGQARQAKQQRSILNRNMERTNDTQDKATKQVLDEAQNYTPEKRMQAMQGAEDAAYAQAQKDISASGGGIVDSAGDAGNVSGEFLKAKADKAITEGNRLTAIAREAAKMRSPTEMMLKEGVRRAGLQGDIAGKFSTARNLANAGQMDAQAVEEPWWGQVGKLAQMAGLASLGQTGLPSFGTPGVDYALSGAQFGDMATASTAPALGQNATGASYLNPTGARIKFGFKP